MAKDITWLYVVGHSGSNFEQNLSQLTKLNFVFSLLSIIFDPIISCVLINDIMIINMINIFDLIKK